MSLKGRVIFKSYRGTAFVQGWPRARGTTVNWVNAYWAEYFRRVQYANKHSAAMLQIAALEASAGTPFLPRDIMTKAAYGNAIAVTQQDGQTYYPANLMSDVSSSLDTISNIVGYTLIRGQDFWEGRPVSGGGDSWAWLTPSGTLINTVDFGAFATIGTRFQVMANAEVRGVAAFWSNGTGPRTYIMSLAKTDSAGLISAIYSTSAYVTPDLLEYPRNWPLSVSMLAGEHWALLLTRTDATNTDQPRPRVHTGGWWDIPIRYTSLTRLAQKAPAVGMTLPATVTNSYPVFGMNVTCDPT